MYGVVKELAICIVGGVSAREGEGLRSAYKKE